MDPHRLQAAEELFHRLAEAAHGEREEVLERACAADPEVRGFVEKLLAHHDSGMGAFLRSPVLTSLEEPSPASDAPLPDRIGHYRIKRLLGEGGMGVVYEARQEHPARAVALKVLRPGLLAGSAFRRFQYEVEVLGRLDHPGIAGIYEAGVASVAMPGGGAVQQPYFAMELVHGRPLMQHVRDHGLSTRARLELLCSVCDAVQHAHQKGIIHRDLKPSNVLVADADATAGSSYPGAAPVEGVRRPKVLDFGVARATDVDIQMTTMHTQTGQIVGTIGYMSPEQAAGNLRQLDVRSDVYALAIIGYEMLTGRLPRELTDVTYAEALRRIRECDAELLGRINKAFSGDLEVIFNKALESDRERRYESAAQFAADIRRYLNNEPIAARRPSTMYQVRKLAVRHKALSTAMVLLFLVLSGFGIGMSLMYRRAERLRIAADRQAVRARQTHLFLEKMLSSIDPEIARGKDTSLIRGILAEASEEAATELVGQPEAEADIRATIGAAYLSVGLAAAAQPQLEAALAIRRSLFGEGHPTVATTLRLLAEAAGKQGHRVQAEALGRQALALRRAQRSVGEAELAEALQTLAWILSELAGKHSEAVSLLRESLAHTDGSSKLRALHAEGMHRLAVVLWRAQQFDEAEATARGTLSAKQRLYGRDHPSVASALDLLGQILTSQKRYDDAEPLIRESVELHRRHFGEDHPIFATALNSLSQLLMVKGDYSAAEPIARQCLDLVTRLRGEDAHETAFAWMNLANLLDKKGDHAEAERLYRIADERFRKVFPADHPYVHSPLTRLAELLDRHGRHESAEPLWGQLVTETRAAFPPGHANHRIAIGKACGLGQCLAEQGKCEAAAAALEECYEGHRANAGPADAETRRAASELLELYERCGFETQAEQMAALLEPHDDRKPEAPPSPP